jgi:uncharacterized protein (TIGR03086 family)
MNGDSATAAAVFEEGLVLFDTVVRQMGASDWERPSPCAGWTALDVLGHLGTSIAMGVSVLRGQQPTWPEVTRPADLVSADPGLYWASISAEVRAALGEADLDQVMETPMGPRTVAQRLAFPAIDLFVHAWDVGHPAGLEVTIPESAVAFAHAYIDPIPAEMVRGPGSIRSRGGAARRRHPDRTVHRLDGSSPPLITAYGPPSPRWAIGLSPAGPTTPRPATGRRGARSR